MFLFLFSLSSFAESIDDWKQAVRSEFSSTHRLEFGEAIVEDNLADAIAVAKNAARAELAKSFKVSVSSTSTVDKATQDFSDSRFNNDLVSTSNISLNTTSIIKNDGIDLVGVDLSRYKVDGEKKLVVAAAVLNIKAYDAYLDQLITGELRILDSKTFRCESSNDLKEIRTAEKSLFKIEKSIETKKLFSNTPDSNQQSILKYQNLVKQCRSKFKISILTNDKDLQYKLSQKISSHGFALDQSSNRSPASHPIKIIISKEISKPESKFDMITLTGRAHIIIKDENQNEVEWYSNTLRQLESSSESALKKIDFRLNELINSSIDQVLEENL